ncbi:hypothetical protein BU26DRAFT_475483 [Trematosphaeria pertusa]|uniref:Uncharacterized protein n=1 Tax=Trematosphaeria pertusa TaxID=390896 RepID=A0A6A6J0J8_9PLEO|nr:uncharacterized protein BU26DRAFT_475483 [Trematosphaeria pertusa]KAF2254933.1 hypothetical protein BU26DRAFT_475483 [Trematosphaeria pertusa]
MHSFNALFFATLLSTSFVSALAPRSSVNGPCTGAGGAPGVCISTSSCSSDGGSFISNACPGTPDDIKCCVKTSCASGGNCRWTSQCSGSGLTSQPGFCPGPTNFQCCTKESTGGGSSGNLPGLNAVQTKRARTIIARAKQDFKSSQQKRACYVAITTAFQESGIRILANSKYPASLKYPHDGVGHDHDSVGIFQQRPSWGSTKERMDASLSAHFFFNALKKISNWPSLAIGKAAQKVQVSAFPDAYDKHITKAKKVCDAGW